MSLRCCNPFLLTALMFLCAMRLCCPAETMLLDGVAAQVNDHTITISDVMTVLEPARRRLFAEYDGPELGEKLEKLYRDALENLIEQRLIIDAYEDQGATLPEWAVDKRINEIIHDSFNDDRDALIELLSKDSITFDEWREDIKEGIIVASMKTVHVNEHVSVSPAAVKAEYENNIAAYTVPEQVKVRMIVIDKTDAESESESLEKASKLSVDLHAGADFAKLASEYSDGSKAAEGGDWGWVNPAKTFRSELAEVVSELDVDEVSEVVATESEFYILKVEGRREEHVAEFEAVQHEIESRLKLDNARAIYDAWISRLKRDAYIKVFEQELFE